MMMMMMMTLLLVWTGLNSRTFIAERLTAGVKWDEAAGVASDVVGAERAYPEMISSTTWCGRPPELGHGAGDGRYRPG